MKMNKKGFTLIELLAVIVILAVIALIAVPQILNILNNARKSAAQDSAYGILKSAETAYTTYLLDNNGNAMPADTTFTCTSSGCTASISSKSISLDFKGTKPTSGKVILDGKGNAKISSTEADYLVINGFKCKMTNATDSTVTCE